MYGTESSGTLFLCTFGGLLFDPDLFPKVPAHLKIQISVLATIGSVLIAFHETGGFFQPVLAYIRTFGCVGVLRQSFKRNPTKLIGRF